jgi:hypothetical protein
LKSLFARLLIGALAWLAVTPSLARADCATPAGVEGEIYYNVDYATMQFCDGTNWISMAAGSPPSESDPEVGTLTPNNFCTSNAGGTQIVCTTATIAISSLTTTGTASSSTFLRGDGVWAAPSFSLPTLTDANIWVGNGSNVATAVVMSGDATLSNAGVLAIGAAKITNTMLAGSISVSKIDATGTAGNTTYLRGDGVWATVSAGATPAGSVAGAIQFRGVTAVLAADDVNFIWDDTNNRIGVGTATPSESIDTTGNVKSVRHVFTPQTGLASPGASGGGIGTLAADAFCTANSGATGIICTTAAVNAGTQLTGTLAAAQFPALTGDVTTTAGSLATTIGASKVTNSMLAGSIALSKLSTTGTASSSTYLRGDGAWTAPGGGFPTTIDFQVFTSTGTWTKPGSGTTAHIECWGGGGGGRNHTILAGGGGGGAYAHTWMALSSLGATVSVTVGNGGAAGSAGQSSTFGAHLTAAGGAAGSNSGSAAGATGAIAAYNGGNGGTPDCAPGTSAGGNAIYGGAGGGGLCNDLSGGGTLVFGNGGSSAYGGDGADPSYTANSITTGAKAAAVPGGGGAAQLAGGKGLCQVTVF